VNAPVYRFRALDGMRRLASSKAKLSIRTRGCKEETSHEEE
jgi:hypothetical protein